MILASDVIKMKGKGALGKKAINLDSVYTRDEPQRHDPERYWNAQET